MRIRTFAAIGLILGVSGIAHGQPTSMPGPDAQAEALALGLRGNWQGGGSSYPRQIDSSIDMAISMDCRAARNESLTACDIGYETGGQTWLAFDVLHLDQRSGDLFVSYHGITLPIVHRYTVEHFEIVDPRDDWSLRAIATDTVGGQLSDMILELSVRNGTFSRVAASRPAGTDDAFRRDTEMRVERDNG